MTLADELANDRTFLAWLRTGIALFGLGFVVAKIAYLIEPEPTGLSDRDFYTIVGVMIVLSGAAIVALGFWQHRAVVGTLGPRADTPRPRWPLAITIVAVVGSLLLSSLIIVSS